MEYGEHRVYCVTLVIEVINFQNYYHSHKYTDEDDDDADEDHDDDDDLEKYC